MNAITSIGMTRLLSLFLSLDAKQELVAELIERKIAFKARCIDE